MLQAGYLARSIAFLITTLNAKNEKKDSLTFIRYSNIAC